MAGLEQRFVKMRQAFEKEGDAVMSALSKELENAADEYDEDFTPEDDMEDMTSYWDEAMGLLDKVQDELARLES